MKTKMKHVALATLAAGVVAMPALALAGTDDHADKAASRAPVAALSAEQVAAIPAFRREATRAVPNVARQVAAQPNIQEKFGPNPDLARAVRPVGGGIAPWTVIPGRDSACLTTGVHEGATCVSLEDAAAGLLYIQLITPPDAKHAVPPPGDPVPSTIIGVAPDGISSVTATTLDGKTIAGEVRDGMYSVSGTDIAWVNLGGEKPRQVRFR